MYVHAFQSAVWNAAASHRAARYGLTRAVAGDLVLLSRGEAEQGLGAGDDGSDADRERRRSGAATTARTHVVGEGDARDGTYGIEDVVLPLPGGGVQYPTHDTAKVRL